MGDYQEFFKAKRQMQKVKAKRLFFGRGQPNRSAPRSSANRSHQRTSLWLILIAGTLACVGLYFFLSGKDDPTAILAASLDRLEFSVFGEASASEAGDMAKVADAKPKSEENSSAKDASHDGTSAQKQVSQTKTWSDEEIALFTKLDDRKKQLDAREAALNKLEAELQKQKEDLEKRLAALEDVRDKIANRLEDKVKADQQKVDTLVAMYSNMKPTQAAQVLSQINDDLAVEVLAKMKNKVAAEILNMMDPQRAKYLTEKFAGVKDTMPESRVPSSNP